MNLVQPTPRDPGMVTLNFAQTGLHTPSAAFGGGYGPPVNPELMNKLDYIMSRLAHLESKPQNSPKRKNATEGRGTSQMKKGSPEVSDYPTDNFRTPQGNLDASGTSHREDEMIKFLKEEMAKKDEEITALRNQISEMRSEHRDATNELIGKIDTLSATISGKSRPKASTYATAPPKNVTPPVGHPERYAREEEKEQSHNQADWNSKDYNAWNSQGADKAMRYKEDKSTRSKQDKKYDSFYNKRNKSVKRAEKMKEKKQLHKKKNSDSAQEGVDYWLKEGYLNRLCQRCDFTGYEPKDKHTRSNCPALGLSFVVYNVERGFTNGVILVKDYEFPDVANPRRMLLEPFYDEDYNTTNFTIKRNFEGKREKFTRWFARMVKNGHSDIFMEREKQGELLKDRTSEESWTKNPDEPERDPNNGHITAPGKTNYWKNFVMPVYLSQENAHIETYKKPEGYVERRRRVPKQHNRLDEEVEIV